MLAAASASSGGSIPEAVYYVIGSAVPLGAAVIGAFKFYSRQKAKWTSEGVQRARSDQVIEANTEAARANTKAIADLSEKFGDFASGVRSELNGHDTRITRLELRQGITPGADHGT